VSETPNTPNLAGPLEADELLDVFLRSRTQRLTRESYQPILRQLQAWLDQHGRTLLTITRKDAVTYADEHLRKTGRGDGTIRKELAVLSAFYTWLADQAPDLYRARNPFEHGPGLPWPPRPETDPGARRWLDKDQLRAVLEAAAKISDTHHVLVGLLALYGQPVDGVQNLVCGDTDLAVGQAGHETINLRTRRGGRLVQRILGPLVKPVRNLAVIPGRPFEPELPLLRTPNGKKLHRRDVAAYCRAAGERGLNLPPDDAVTATLLHQTFLQHAVRANVPDQQIKALTGQGSEVLDGTRKALEETAPEVLERYISYSP
jgi:integrase